MRPIKQPGLTAILLLLIGGAAFGAAAPSLTVPVTARAPVIDGKIVGEEWKGAAAITGFIEYKSRQLDPRPVVAYITHDDSNLYMAFKLPVYPEGAALVADFRKRDSGWGGDDILEVLLDPNFGSYEAEDSFYQFMGNSAGYILLDQANSPAIGIFDQLEWDGIWNFKNSVSGSVWQAELGIALSELQVKRIEQGEKWLTHFSRTWGGPFIWTWTTLSAAAKTLNVPGGGAELTFDADAPAVRLLSVEPVTRGRFGFSGEVTGGAKDTGLKIEATVSSGDRTIASKVIDLRVPAGRTVPFSLDESAELEKENVLSIKVSDADSGKVYLRTAIPFLKQPVYPAVPMVEKKSFAFTARYLPSYRKVWLDELDCSRLPEIAAIRSARLSIVPEGRDEPVFSKLLDIREGRIEDIGIETPKLSRGDYSLTIELLDGKGREIACEKCPIIIRSFPFEKEKVGVSGGILPPYVPMSVDGKAISVLGRTYALSVAGLFDQITAHQPEPTLGEATEPVLASPMSIIAEIDGKPTELKSVEPVRIVKISAESVLARAESRAGNLKVEISNLIEYDGVAKVEMTLTPLGKVDVARLALLIPLRASQATLLHELNDTIRRNYAGFTPNGEGVVWDSLRIRNTRGCLGNFKPVYWLGNEDRGISWFAESDEGWVTDDKKACQQIIREQDRVILRINLINSDVTLTKPRKIVFGFVATPVKTPPNDWRRWLFSVEEPLPGMRHFQIVGGPRRPFHAYPENGCPYPSDWEKAKEQFDWLKDTLKSTYLLYQQLQFIHTEIEEYPVYGNEWHPVDCYGEESYHDFRAWCLDQYLMRCGQHSFYDDNAYLTPLKDKSRGYGYLREDGEYQGEFPIFKMREYFRRLATVYKENGMENIFGVHKSNAMIAPCYTFTTFALDGEQRFVTTQSTDHIDQFPLEFIRAHIMGRQFGFIPLFLDEIHLSEDKDQAAIRALVSLLLLHELPVWPAYAPDKRAYMMIDKMKSEFGYGEPDVKFYPYWGEGRYDVAGANSDKIKVSLWKRPDRMLAVVANLAETEQKTSVQFDFEKLGFRPQVVYDYESKAALVLEGSALKMAIPGHNFRLVWMERAP